MYAIILITAAVLIVSLYEFYTSRNWQQVTSNTRNEVVFENRNKTYGAYQIRKDYDRNFVLIMLGLMGSVGIAYGAYLFTRSNSEFKIDIPTDHPNDPDIVIDFPDNPPIKTPPVDKQLDNQTAKTEQFIEPVITDKPVENNVKTQDQIEGTTVSSTTSNGTGDQFTATTSSTTTTVIAEPIPDVIPDFVDVDASFPGGYSEMMKFLSNNIRYPEDVLQMGGQGKVMLRFVVGKDGEIEQISVIRGVQGFEELDMEAMRVVKKMPKWKPAQINGKAVKSYFTLPISFQLN